MPALVLYHANCPDGFCAAWVCRLAMPDCECIPVMYGQEPPDVNRREVFIVDFSYPRNVLERMNREADSLVVLDHHKTAQADLEGLPYCHFDMNKSGGRLAWEHFFPGKESPWLVDYTEARDLWTFHLPFSREVSAAIASYPMDFQLWNELEKALSNDPTNLRNMRNNLRETAADFSRRKAEKVLHA